MICSTIEEYGAHGQMAGAVGVGHGMSMTMAEYASHRTDALDARLTWYKENPAATWVRRMFTQR